MNTLYDKSTISDFFNWAQKNTFPFRNEGEYMIVGIEGYFGKHFTADEIFEVYLFEVVYKEDEQGHTE